MKKIMNKFESFESEYGKLNDPSFVGAFLNDSYIVYKHIYKNKEKPHLINLSIKRRDRQPIHDWRDIQEIKNQLTSPEHEAVELYPAESRKVDTANQYFLWIIDDPKFKFPFGFKERLIADEDELNIKAAEDATQRPFGFKGTGRNDPCPCGSTKKYKHCCIDRHINIKKSEEEYEGKNI